MPTRARALVSAILIALFVDAVWPHRWWGCHQTSERSFSIDGRQFHVCARCTGLIVGLPLSLLLIPWRGHLPLIGLACVVALVVDGGTQWLGWRTSNNTLRFVTGVSASATLLPALLALGRF